jgi:hypothetical protein
MKFVALFSLGLMILCSCIGLAVLDRLNEIERIKERCERKGYFEFHGQTYVCVKIRPPKETTLL